MDEAAREGLPRPLWWVSPRAMTFFELLVIGGAIVTFAGFLALIWCILRVAKARRAKLPDEEMRDVLQKIVPVNFAALAVSVMGLMLVIIGISLG